MNDSIPVSFYFFEILMGYSLVCIEITYVSREFVIQLLTLYNHNEKDSIHQHWL